MIHFTNPGEIDIRALTTFGLSSKDGETTIGRFGTGLKYATAVIARNGGKITIQTGGENYTIGTVEDDFRGKPVKTLTMNGQPLPYTTDLGRDWEPWMAFRELYANALDEGGDVGRSDDLGESCGDETRVSVDLNAFEAIFFSMEEHFIGQDETPVAKSSSIEIYEGRSLFIFYRGIAILKLKEPAAFRYNLLGHTDLTEDRTAKYDWQVRSRIESGLAHTDNEAVARAACDMRNPFEAELDYSRDKPSDVFLGAAVALGENCNPTAMALVRAQLPANPNEVDTYTVVSTEQKGGKELMSALQKVRDAGGDMSKAQFVLATGVPLFKDYEVRGKAVFLNEKIFGDQRRMDVACLSGFAEIMGNGWLARRLLEVTAKRRMST